MLSAMAESQQTPDLGPFTHEELHFLAAHADRARKEGVSPEESLKRAREALRQRRQQPPQPEQKP